MQPDITGYIPKKELDYESNQLKRGIKYSVEKESENKPGCQTRIRGTNNIMQDLLEEDGNDHLMKLGAEFNFEEKYVENKVMGMILSCHYISRGTKIKRERIKIKTKMKNDQIKSTRATTVL